MASGPLCIERKKCALRDAWLEHDTLDAIEAVQEIAAEGPWIYDSAPNIGVAPAMNFSMAGSILRSNLAKINRITRPVSGRKSL